MRIQALIGIVLAFLLTSVIPSVAAQTGPTPTALYDVELILSSGGRVVGDPKFKVRAGSSAIMTVDREGGYGVRVAAVRSQTKPDQVVLSSEIHIKQQGRWVARAAPTFNLGLSSPVWMTVPERTLSDGARLAAFRVDARISDAGKTAALVEKPCTAAREAAWRATMANNGPKLVLAQHRRSVVATPAVCGVAEMRLAAPIR